MPEHLVLGSLNPTKRQHSLGVGQIGLYTGSLSFLELVLRYLVFCNSATWRWALLGQWKVNFLPFAESYEYRLAVETSCSRVIIRVICLHVPHVCDIRVVLTLRMNEGWGWGMQTTGFYSQMRIEVRFKCLNNNQNHFNVLYIASDFAPAACVVPVPVRAIFVDPGQTKPNPCSTLLHDLHPLVWSASNDLDCVATTCMCQRDKNTKIELSIDLSR